MAADEPGSPAAPHGDGAPDDTLSRRAALKALAVAAPAAAAALAACGRADAGAPAEETATMTTTTDRPAREEAGGPAAEAPRPRMPVIYLPHGCGPCFFMEWRMGPPDTWDRMAAYLRGLPGTLPAEPRALLVISAHWEEAACTVTSSARPPLLYDYYGFPPHTYELTWPAPGDPALAARVRELLGAAGLPTAEDGARGLDHGVFIPLKLAWPDARLPTVQLSLRRGLDPAEHVAIGRALAPLRDEGVLILGSGMSFHNLRTFGQPGWLDRSRAFDGWMAEAVALPDDARAARLAAWTEAPAARACHPREEHLLPLMVAAGAAGADPGRVPYRDDVMGVTVSAVHFG